MADTDQEKTEEATPKRRDEALAEGRIPRSQELNSAILLLGSAAVLNSAGGGLGTALATGMTTGLLAAGSARMDAAGAVSLVQATGGRALAALSVFLLAMAGIALAVAAAQARGVVSLKPVTPQWERIDPLSNGARMLGAQPWMELGKSLAKLLIVAVAVRGSLSDAWPEILALAQESPVGLLEVVRRHGLRLLQTAGFSYLAFAGVDVFLQLRQHEKGLRMTKDEVKREMKESDGDPLLKARMRSMARSLARKQMLRDVPQADVVITNPTHIAVAIRYDPEKAPAPMIVAMGQRKVAERIKQIARDNGVPCVENKPVARALLASAQVGMMIPQELYVAVAEVLAFVIRQRQARNGWPGSALG
ncbi:MAG TPA: flagellar type III secretion system protein FlhB [Longimicrobiaceae bacterium]